MKYDNPMFFFRGYGLMRRVRRGVNFLEIGPGNLHPAGELLSRFERGTLVDHNTAQVNAIHDGLPAAQKQRLQLITGDFTDSRPIGDRFDCGRPYLGAFAPLAYKYTFYPLSLIASLFNCLDQADGYFA